MLHFAYGSNMDRTAMARRCRDARALGTATLENWRFVIVREGYASIMPASGDVVHGVLWRLSARDLAALNAYEALDSGLYRRRMLPVRGSAGCVQALVYVARGREPGCPAPGYQDVIVRAARDWHLPGAYVRALERWSPGRLGAARRMETGEIA